MGKFHLQKSQSSSTSQFKLPTLGGGGIKLGGQSGFSLPKLGTSSAASGASSLANFANAQLKSYEESKVTTDQTEPKKFAIPKLFPSKPANPLAVDLLVDLKSALVPLSEQMKSLNLKKNLPVETATFEHFIPKFVDCDVIVDPKSREMQYDENCHPFTADELRSQFKDLNFKRFTSVGRVVKRRFHRKKPRIQHKFKHKHEVVRFKFDTLSPDEVILSHLNKTRK